MPSSVFAYTEEFFCRESGDASAPKTQAGAFDLADIIGTTYTALIDAVDDKIGPNDIVWMLDTDGDIVGKLDPLRDGLIGKPITYQAYPEHNPVIDGGAETYALDASNRDYLIFNGIDFKDGTSAAVVFTTSTNITIQHSNIYNTDPAEHGIHFNGASSYINIEDSNIWTTAGTGGNAILMAGTGGGTQDHNSLVRVNVVDSGLAGLQVTQATGVISNLYIEDYSILSADTMGMAFLNLDTSDDVTINGADITGVGNDASGYGININACDGALFTISGSTIYDCPNFGVYVFNSNLDSSSIITGASITSNDKSGIRMTASSNLTIYGGDISYSGEGTTNAIHGIWISDKDAAAADTSVLISHCTINYNHCDGVFITGTADGVIITNCEGAYNGQVGSLDATCGDAFTPHDTVANLVIKYSVMHHNGNTGMASISTGTGNEFYHNVVAYNGIITGQQNRAGFFFNDPTGAGEWTVKNNIFVANYPRELVWSTATEAQDDVTIDYNRYYHIGNGVTESNFASVDKDVGDTNIPYATYIGSHESSNTESGNPLLKSTTNFRLNSPSTAIDAGLIISGVNDGSERGIYGSKIAGLPNIGASQVAMLPESGATGVITNIVD